MGLLSFNISLTLKPTTISQLQLFMMIILLTNWSFWLNQTRVFLNQIIHHQICHVARKWYRSAVPNIILLAYPQSRKKKTHVPLCLLGRHFMAFFTWNLSVNLKLFWKLGLPLEISHVPLGVRVPQIGNDWSRL